MSTGSSPPGAVPDLLKLVGPSLERIAKDASSRKHGKLIQECKAVLDYLAHGDDADIKPLTTVAEPTPEAPPSPPPAEEVKDPSASLADSDTSEVDRELKVEPTQSEDFAVPEKEDKYREDVSSRRDDRKDAKDDRHDERFVGQAKAERDAVVVFKVLKLACETQQPRLVEPALYCFQKLIAYGFLRGEMEAGPGKNHQLLADALDVICRCYDIPDETTELQVIKVLLTIVTSSSFQVHGEGLLKAVRTCYNIFLGSKNEVNQSTAKASLTQMLNIVFRRMEADSPSVALASISVSELFEPAGGLASDGPVVQFVQNFMNKVMQDIESAFYYSSQPQSPGHGGAFDTPPAAASGDTELNELVDRDVLDVKDWEIKTYKRMSAEKSEESQDVSKSDEVDTASVRSSGLKRDAFLVFRALCKLSMKQPPAEGVLDPFAIRGKVLSLEMLKILLENSGSVFRNSEKFIAAIRQYLCLSLLKNVSSPLMNVFQLSCSIFMTLVMRFRDKLKAEIGVFFPMIILRVLENNAGPNYLQKSTVLRFLYKLSDDPQVLVDIFVNYDCDLESSNIFERIVNGLLKTVQGVPTSGDSQPSPAQEQALRMEGMHCVVGVVRAMAAWVNRYQVDTAPAAAAAGDQDNGEGDETPKAKTFDAEKFEQRKAYKTEFEEGIALFNRKPKKGIEFLQSTGKIGNSPSDIANFLKSTLGLNKTMIGEYLGEREETNLKVMHAYVDSMEFSGLVFDEAIRTFLNGFRLPGEAQKIDRLMEKFAERFCKNNPDVFSSADTAYVLAYSVIMLNTDAHNPGVKSKMSKADFIKNNRGINNSEDLPAEFLEGLYDRITTNEIKMKPDGPSLAAGAQGGKLGGLDSILNLVTKRKTVQVYETSEEIIKHTQEMMREKGKTGSIFYAAKHIENVRPMLEVAWPPMMAAFSVPLENSEEGQTVALCLEGYRHSIRIASVLYMEVIRDAFMTSLAKFTSLRAIGDIKQKNIEAIRTLLLVAEEDGNYLQESWVHVLKCVSRFEQLHLINEGAVADSILFAPREEAAKVDAKPKKTARRTPSKKGSGSFSGLDDSGLQLGVGMQTPEALASIALLEQVDIQEMNRLFAQSAQLNSEAIVDFVKALCQVSMEELKSPQSPRVFSLTKIVEIAHFNMQRIRLVWTHIWSVLAEYFVTVGCHKNLSVAMYAVDSLRQLAMKFLERDELANYTFQNDFLKPFVIVMRKSTSMEIRELVIRCVSQMVFARARNIKSGWKSMFMVFTTAASDDQRAIVQLAFETIEKIVREYFGFITETEAATFTDCVNCLIAFTNNAFSQDVSLNAIAFLRFCALKLAEGVLLREKVGEDIPDQDKLTDKDVHVYFWFPLLAGLSELSFDPRPNIRKSALEVLFDTLRFHGQMFSAEFWERVYESVLFPIFDYVRRNSTLAGARKAAAQQAEEIDAWLYETCTIALQLVVDLFIKFYLETAPLLGRMITFITNFIKRRHQNLASVAVAAFVRLVVQLGPALTIETWQQVLTALRNTATSTLPNVAALATAGPLLDKSDSIRSPKSSVSGAGSPVTPARSNGVASTPSPGDKTREVVPEMQDDRRDSNGSSVSTSDPTYVEQLVADVRRCAAVQLLFVQAVSELFSRHITLLAPQHVVLLLDTLQLIAAHARNVNVDHQLRVRLRHVCTLEQVPDPPLLRLENEAVHAYMSVLLHMAATSISKGKGALAPDVPTGTFSVEDRLMTICMEVMQVFTSLVDPARLPRDTDRSVLAPAVLDHLQRREVAARAPVVVATLLALRAFDDATFKSHLPKLFPLLVELIRCRHTQIDVQQALSELFVLRIGPLLPLQSNGVVAS
eukprot:jgi/Chlat1/4679/Chrsp3S05617